jgi:hypothetical protein
MSSVAPELVSEHGLGQTRSLLGPAPALISEHGAGQMTAQPRMGIPDLPPGVNPGGGIQSPSGGPAGGMSITGIRSWADLQRAAMGQVNSEIAGQEAPLKGELSSLGVREGNAQGSLSAMFGSIMPYVSNSAQQVTDTYNDSLNQEQGIFSAANQQMSQFLQQRSQQAQALAQEMGGPVAVDDFTSPLMPYAGSLINEGTTSMLHALGEAQSGEQEAQAFAGKVMPLVETEQHKSLSDSFEAQRSSIQKQIDTLEGTKQGAINSRLNDLLKSERDFALQKNQQKLDTAKSNRDWTATKHTLANDDARLKLAQQQFGVQTKDTAARLKLAQGQFNQNTKVQNEQLRQSAIRIDNQSLEAAAKLNLSKAQLQQKIDHSAETATIAKQRIAVQAQKNAMSTVEALMGSSKPISMTVRRTIPQTAGIIAIAHGKTDVHYDPKTKSYYTYHTETMTPQQWKQQRGISVGTTIGDPNQLYQILVQSNTPKQTALAVIRARFGKKWNPGDGSRNAQTNMSYPPNTNIAPQEDPSAVDPSTVGG